MPDQKRPDNAEIDAMLGSVKQLTKLTCSELCDEQANDFDILQNLGDFPENQRARVRAAILRDLATVRTELKQQKCPAC